MWEPEDLVSVEIIDNIKYGLYHNAYDYKYARVEGFEEGYETSTITIPEQVSTSEVDVYQVIKINDGAFSGKTVLTEITLASIMNEIGSYAFYSCSNLILESGDLMDVESIGYNAFGECSSISSVNLPNIVTISTDAFTGCTALKTLTIKNLDTVNGAFTSAPIEDLTIVGEGGVAESFGDGFDKTKLKTLTTGTGITEIGYRAFEYSEALTTITLSNVVTIHSEAFYNCDALTITSLPLVKTIEGSAFWGCDVLTEIDLSSVETVENSAFFGCGTLTTITFSSIKIIDWHAFEDCKVSSLSFPNTIELIGYRAFDGNPTLGTVDIDAENVVLGKWAFWGADKVVITKAKLLKKGFCSAATPLEIKEGSGVRFEYGFFEEASVPTDFIINGVAVDMKTTIERANFEKPEPIVPLGFPNNP